MLLNFCIAGILFHYCFDINNIYFGLDYFLFTHNNSTLTGKLTGKLLKGKFDPKTKEVVQPGLKACPLVLQQPCHMIRYVHLDILFHKQDKRTIA